MEGCKNQFIMKYHSKLLVFNICHIEFIIYIRTDLPLETFWVGFPIKKYKQQPGHIRLQLNSGKHK